MEAFWFVEGYRWYIQSLAGHGANVSLLLVCLALGYIYMASLGMGFSFLFHDFLVNYSLLDYGFLTPLHIYSLCILR